MSDKNWYGEYSRLENEMETYLDRILEVIPKGQDKPKPSLKEALEKLIDQYELRGEQITHYSSLWRKFNAVAGSYETLKEKYDELKALVNPENVALLNWAREKMREGKVEFVIKEKEVKL